MNTTKTTNLYAAKEGHPLKIVSVANIALLESLGVRLGTQLAVKNRYTFGGPVLLRIEDSYSVAIGKDIATQILVQEVCEA